MNIINYTLYTTTTPNRGISCTFLGTEKEFALFMARIEAEPDFVKWNRRSTVYIPMRR